MHRETVVVIDDEESMREGCRQALEGQGYVARVATDGEEGVHLVEQLKPEVVLVDLKMPGIDGMETLRRIKQIDPYVVSIVITGYGTIESSVTAMRLGASDYLCKPFDDDQLLTAVESCLEEHAVQQKEASLLPLAHEGSANRQTIIEVLERAACEWSFAAELMEKGSEALDAYKLTSAEKAAIAVGDLAWIENHVGKLNDKQRSWLNCRLAQERW